MIDDAEVWAKLSTDVVLRERVQTLTYKCDIVHNAIPVEYSKQWTVRPSMSSKPDVKHQQEYD